MRHARLVLRPDAEGFHPADREIVDAEAVERVAIQHFNQLDDGTIVFLYRLRGDPAVASHFLAENSDVLTHSISQDDDELHAYVHVEPNETVRRVFRLPQEHSIVVRTPIECLPGGDIRVSVVGTDKTFARALAVVPEAIDVELEAIRDYAPEDGRLFARLTARQQEILETAVAVGYYDVPRAATHEDVAAAFDLAAVTVGEHLRKIEASVLTAILPGGDTDG